MHQDKNVQLGSLWFILQLKLCILRTMHMALLLPIQITSCLHHQRSPTYSMYTHFFTVIALKYVIEQTTYFDNDRATLSIFELRLIVEVILAFIIICKAKKYFYNYLNNYSSLELSSVLASLFIIKLFELTIRILWFTPKYKYLLFNKRKTSILN